MKLILLPGMDGTGELFADFVKALPDTIEPVVITYPEKDEFSYQQLEALVAGKLPSNGDYFILGESFSGPIAIALAAKAPKGLKGLILCCSFAKNPRPLLTQLGGLLPVSAVPKGIRDSMMLGWHSEPDIALLLDKVLQHTPDNVLRYRIREVSRCNVESLLNSIAVPVLYIRARQDRIIPENTANGIIDKISEAKIVDLDGPHMVLQVKPSASAQVISSFVQEMGTAR